MTNKCFKITLKAARVNAGMTQKEAAEALHVSNTTLVKWENGERFPDVSRVDEICNLYNVEYSNLNFLPKQAQA